MSAQESTAPTIRRTPDWNLAGFYLLAALWFAAKSIVLATRTVYRPDALIVPSDWFATVLGVMPVSVSVLVVAFVAAMSSIAAARLAMGASSGVLVRVGVFVVALAVNSIDHSEGAISHWNHLLLFGLFLGTAIDLPTASDLDVRLFQFGLTTTYALAGYWKVRQIQAALAADSVDGTWLDPTALASTVRRNQFALDRDAFALRLIDRLEPLTPAIFVMTTVLFVAMPLLVWKWQGRVVIAVVAFTFHWVNWWVLGAAFRFAGVLAFVAFMPFAELSQWWRGVSAWWGHRRDAEAPRAGEVSARRSTARVARSA